MTKRIILIILAAAVLALVVGLAWFWFFSGSGAPQPQSGTFGTGQNRSSGSGASGEAASNNNIPSNVTGAQGGANAATGGGSSLGGGAPFAQGSLGAIPSVGSVPGVDWLGGSVSGGVGPAGGSSFVPKTVNQLNNSTVSGSPTILGTYGSNPGSNNSNNLGLAVGGIIGAGVGCAALFGFQSLGEAKAAAEGATVGLGGGFVLVYDWRQAAKQSSNQFKDTGDCLARTIGRAVIQQMTNSVVNWINSGFNGKPSFVTNFQQYFTNVGDQAAGEFIRGTALSFLCSPFQLKIRIAIAQSYARRNNAASCTLTGIGKNLDRFINGNFNAGGWGSLLQFTTIPTNNPYGAYAYAQIGLNNAQSNALNNANRNITPGGFISLQKCETLPGPTQDGKPLQDCKVVTPGSVIEDSLKETLKQPYLANQLAQSFDQIISALMNQLITKTLYNGLTSLSGQNGYASDYLTPEQQQAQNTAQGLLSDLQAKVQIAQQFGAVAQGSIGDIQNAQQLLKSLADCYATKGKTAQASSTEDLIAGYNSQVDAYNTTITKANQAIAVLQDLQSRTLNVVTPQDVAAVQAAYTQAQGSGALFTQADVTNAQQDRTTLQANLANRNATTQSDLQQCNAL